MIKIDINTVEENERNAERSERKRNIKSFGKPEESMQRMINSLCPETYMRPHRHKEPAKREVFIAIRGETGVITFQDSGEIKETAVISPEGPVFGVEIQPGEWHCAVSLNKTSTVFEILDGPYDPVTHKEFATWSPEEKDTEKAKQFLDTLKEAVRKEANKNR